MKLFQIILIALLSLFYSFLPAQKFTASAGGSKMGINQSVEVQFTAEGSGVSEFHQPAFGAFTVLQGPMESSMSMNINGAESETFTYVLQPTVKGKLTIGPASVKIGGKVYKSNPLTIEVVDAAQVPGAGNRNKPSNPPQNQQSPTTNNKDNIFVRASVNNPNPYQGQQLVLTYKIYTAVTLLNYQRPTPKLDGFWVQQEDVPQNPPTSEEVVNGKKYLVATIYKSYLFPQKEGELTINSLNLDMVMRLKVKRSSGWDDFFSNPFFDNPFDYQDVKQKVTSNAVKVTVKPLPAGKPAGFTGMVGDFNFIVKADKTKTKTNDPVTLKIEINGRGNLKLIEPYDLDLPSDIETFEPKVKDGISAVGDVVSGYKVFEYLLVPHKEGNYKIPGLSFSYFDVAKGIYRTLNSEEINITVGKGSGVDYSSLPPGVSQKDVEFRGKDIQFIRLSAGDLHPAGKFYFLTGRYFLMLVLPLLLFVIFLFIKQRNDRMKSNMVLMKSRRANTVARKQLKIAEKFLKENNADDFYPAISRAFSKYICDKLNVPFAELSKEKMREVLTEKNLEAGMIDKLLAHLESCEFARYAPAQSIPGLPDIYAKSLDLLSNIEKQLR